MTAVQIDQEFAAAVRGRPRLVSPKLTFELVFRHCPSVELAKAAHHAFALLAVQKPRVRLEPGLAATGVDDESGLRGDRAAFGLEELESWVRLSRLPDVEDQFGG